MLSDNGKESNTAKEVLRLSLMNLKTLYLTKKYSDKK